MITDSELWQQIKQGNQLALEMLYKRHYQTLFRYALKFTKEKEPAQDSIQDLFFELWTKRETLKDVASVKFYLMKWLKREVIRTLTGKSVSNNSVSLDTEAHELGNITEDLMEKNEFALHQSKTIKQAIEQLTAREKEVIYLRFYLELTYEEICGIMNLSYQVVMNYVHRALKALRAGSLGGKILLTVWPLSGIFTFIHLLVG